MQINQCHPCTVILIVPREECLSEWYKYLMPESNVKYKSKKRNKENSLVEKTTLHCFCSKEEF